MNSRPDPVSGFDAIPEPGEPMAAHYHLTQAETAARRVNGNGHSHAIARRAPQPITHENGTTAPVRIETVPRILTPEPAYVPALLPRHGLAATFAALSAAGSRTVLVSSPLRQGGSSTFVEAAGRAIAGSGLGSVVLVDAAAHHPSLHRRFELPCARGLTDALDELYGFDLQGEDASQFGIGDWLEVLRAQGRTGQLTVRGENRTYVITILRGRACALSCLEGTLASRLGERLVQRGRISGEQRDAAFRIHQETARPLGEVLSALGFVESQDLVEVLQQQCVRGLVELIAMSAPECRFDERAESHLCGVGAGRFGLPAARGLDRLLSGRVLEYLKQPFLSSQTPSFLRDTEMPALKVLVAGERLCDLTNASRQAAFGLLLGRLAQAFDFVIVDAPAAGAPGGGDVTPALATYADGALLVVGADAATGTAARATLEDYRRAGARMLGLVLNRAGSRRRA
jgi:Mrp family chromosome partitioning ATPase